MKRALIILIVIGAFVGGVAAHSAFAIYRSPMPDMPAVATVALPYPRPRNIVARYVVVTILNDHEFFIGKDRLTLTDVPDRIRQQIGYLPPEHRLVFIKGEPSVKFDTLSAVMRAIRDADVYEIEVIPILR
jgi:biopolymer transport protein ExbD